MTLNTKALFYRQSGNPTGKVEALASERLIYSLRSGKIPKCDHVRLWTPGSPSALSPLDLLSFKREVSRAINENPRLTIWLNHENYYDSAFVGAREALSFLVREFPDTDIQYTSYPNFFKIERWKREIAPLLVEAGATARAQAYLAPGKKDAKRALNGRYGVNWVFDGCPKMMRSICQPMGLGWALDIGFHHVGSGDIKKNALLVSQLANENAWRMGAADDYVAIWSSAWLSTPRVNGSTREQLLQFLRTFELPTAGSPRELQLARQWISSRAGYLGGWVKDSVEKG